LFAKSLLISDFMCTFAASKIAHDMNYEEMLQASEKSSIGKEKLLIGTLCKRQLDGKYRNIVTVRQDLADSADFREALQQDQQYTARLNMAQQVHYEVLSMEHGVCELELEAGTYQTLERVLAEDPSLVARSGFMTDLTHQLVEAAKRLQQDGVGQWCFAPRNILLTKGGSRPLLLCHGSLMKGVAPALLYQGVEEYVAPEVMQTGSGDARSDVYSLGKMLEKVYENGDMPMGMKKVVAKAADEDPKKRYATVEAMAADMKKRNDMRRSLLTMLAAVAVTLVCVGVYFDMMPQTEKIEFEDHSTQQNSEEEWFGDENFDPEAELSGDPDSANVDGDTLFTQDEKKRLDAYQAKAEEIFKKQFEKQADRILSKVYSNERMGSEEKSFVAGSKQLMEELIGEQTKLGEEAGLSPERTGQLANDIITRLTKEKQQALTKKGYQK